MNDNKRAGAPSAMPPKERRAPMAGEWRVRVPIIAFAGPFAFIAEWNGVEWLNHTAPEMASYKNGMEGIAENKALTQKCRAHNAALGIDHDDLPQGV